MPKITKTSHEGYYVASWSGGKDSTYMVDELLRRDEKLDEIIFCDTGYEFPQMYTYIEHMQEYWQNKYPKLKITKLNYKTARDIWSNRSEKVWTKGNYKGKARGFPHHIGMSWCTRELKINPLKKYLKQFKYKNVYHYIGIAYNEPNRVKNNGDIYPLVNWKITETEIKEKLLTRGLHNPLYNHFTRTGCFLCPKQSMRSLYKLWKHYPEQWREIKILQTKYKKLNSSTWLFKAQTTDELQEKFKEYKRNGFFNELDIKEEEIGCFCK